MKADLQNKMYRLLWREMEMAKYVSKIICKY